MTVTRTVISIKEDDKAWLEAESQRRGISAAELIRQSIDYFRGAEQRDFDRAALKVAGTWRHGDGLAFQTKQRDEWQILRTHPTARDTLQ